MAKKRVTVNVKAGAAAVEAAAEKLLARGLNARAAALALAAALKAPRSPALARLLERTLSLAGAKAEAQRAYSRLALLPEAHPSHFYHLAMFRKRAGDMGGMRRAFLTFTERAGDSDPVNSYIAFCTLDRWSEAFRAAERLLDAPGSEPVLSRLWNPWGDRSSGMPHGFLRERLRVLDRAELPPVLSFYRRFMRGALLGSLGLYARALGEFSRLPRLPAARYGWMRFPEGWAAQRLGLCARARRAFRAAARSPVSAAQAAGRLAELLVCSGRAREGLALFDRALAGAHYSQVPGLLCWKGQMLLFTGRYAEALKALTGGGRRGDDAAWCWRGAALAMLGRRQEALDDLRKAVELFPTDQEALAWLGETLELGGRPREALRFFRRALGPAGNHPWAALGLGTAGAALGEKGAAGAAFARLPARWRSFLIKRFPRRPGEAAGEAALRRLKGARALSAGNRRDDAYFEALWMKTGRA